MCIVLYKRTFEKKRFIVLVKTALYTCIAGAGFLVPFIQYFIKGGIVATDVDRFYTGIQQYGATYTVFEPFTTYSGLTPDIDSSISAAMPVNAGAALGFGCNSAYICACYGICQGEKGTGGSVDFACICSVIGVDVNMSLSVECD